KERNQLNADTPDRRDEGLAERPLVAICIVAVGGSRPCVHARIDEFLLERGEDLQSGLAPQILDSPAQKIARAANPRLAVRSANVGEIETLGGKAFELDFHFGGRIRNQGEI